MTNYERIKNMSVDEMAKEIFDKVEEGCRYCSRRKCSPIATERDCISGIVEYLNSEAMPNYEKIRSMSIEEVERWIESEVGQ